MDNRIERAARAMAGDGWDSLGDGERDRYRDLAQRAAAVLRPGVYDREGEPVTDDDLRLTLRLVLSRYGSDLQAPRSRPADRERAREIVADKQVEALRRSGYRITLGRGSAPAGALQPK